MIACIGGAHLDRHGILRGPMVLGTSNPGAVHVAFGGVARNVSENLARLGAEVTLVSRVGCDAAGREVRHHVANLGIDASLFTASETQPTASYTAILESGGELVIGLADMQVYEEITPAVLEPALARLQGHSHWFIDANVPGPAIDWLLSQAGPIPVAVDAISVARAPRLSPLLPRIQLLFSNLAQAAVLLGASHRLDLLEATRGLRELGARAGVVTGGAAGIAVWQGDRTAAFPALAAKPRDVTGAGDALVAATLFRILQNRPLEEAAQWGLAAAAITVESPHAAAPELTAALVSERHARTC